MKVKTAFTRIDFEIGITCRGGDLLRYTDWIIEQRNREKFSRFGNTAEHKILLQLSMVISNGIVMSQILLSCFSFIIFF